MIEQERQYVEVGAQLEQAIAQGRQDGLALLRKSFPAHQISKLPKPTKAQTLAVSNDFKKGMRCAACGSWHHPDVIHLDYVGHAALTDRLLDADPAWNWEFQSTGQDGLPVLDSDGGLWIRLTVCGVTRLGYGDAQGKTGGNAMKERIGDALRNAAMRFGAALDLWHKGELHIDEESDAPPAAKEKPALPKATATAITPNAGAGDGEDVPEKGSSTLSEEQIGNIIDLCRETKFPVEEINKRAGTEVLAEIANDAYPEIVAALEKRLAKINAAKTETVPA